MPKAKEIGETSEGFYEIILLWPKLMMKGLVVYMMLISVVAVLVGITWGLLQIYEWII